MAEHSHKQAEFWDDLAGVVDGEPEAVEKYADLLADSDVHRDARHDAERIAGMAADAGMDYEHPADFDARVLGAIDQASPYAPKETPQGAAPQAGTLPHGSGTPVVAAVSGQHVSQPRTEAMAAHSQPAHSQPAVSQPQTPPQSVTGARKKKDKGARVVMLFGFAAAAAALLAVVGVGGYALFGGDDTVTDPDSPFTAQVGSLAARIEVIERAANDGQSGASFAMPGQDQQTALIAGAEVPSGSVIRTDARTRMRIALSDGSTVTLNHSTQVTLDGDNIRTIRLDEGELVADVAHLDEGPQAVYATPTGNVEVLGTKFVLSAASDLASVRVTRGAVRVTSATGGGSYEVKAGEEGTMPAAAPASVSPATNLASDVVWSELGGREEGAETAIRGVGELRAKAPGDREETERPLTLAHHKATVRIVGNVARTTIEETFQNDSNETLEGIYRFPLPPDARIASLSLEVEDQWEEGAFVERNRAQKIWRGVIRNATPRRQRERQEEFIWVPGPWRDPALLEWQRGGRFELRIFPIPANGARRIRLSYTQTIAPHGPSNRRFVLPLAHSADESTRVGNFEVDVRVAGHDGDVTAHGYELNETQDGEATRLSYQANNFLPAGDLLLDYRLQNPDSEIRWWTFRGAATAPPPEQTREGNDEVLQHHRTLHGDDRGYAVFALRPELPAWAEGRSRDYVIVVDSSQSMVGERFDRANQLIGGLVGEMDRRDRFTVMACDVECQVMAENLIAPSATTATQASDFLTSVRPAGASDLVANLRSALELVQEKREDDRDLRVMYIGDGVASVGHRRASSLSAEVEEMLGEDPSVTFTTVGIGGDSDTMNLSAIARAGGGHYVPYVPGQRASTAALAVLETTYGVSLRSADLQLPDGVVDVAPTRLPTIRSGEEVLVVGRLTQENVSGNVQLRGKVAGQRFEQTYPVTLATSTSQGNAFVPRQWASGQIEQLQLAGRGEDESRIIAMSKAFGVLSRHTSLLVLESEAMFQAFGVDRGQPTIQWTGDEDMEMGESEGANEVGSGERQSALGGTLSGFGRGGSGGAAAPMRRRSARAPAPAPADRGDFDDAMAAEAPRQEVAATAEAEPVEEARARPATSRPRGPGQWMRREWFRVGNVVSTGDAVREGWRRQVNEAETALQANPNSRDRHRDLAKALMRTGDLDRAREVVDAWIERDQLDPEALTYLGDVLARQGRRSEAIRTLSGVVDLRSDDRALHERLADAFDRAGMNARACAHRIALAEIRPDDADTQGNALRCERAQGRSAAADRLLAALTDADAREAANRAASETRRETRVRGNLMLNATWEGSSDVDLSLVSSRGTRISWMGGRSNVVGEDAGRVGREKLGIRWAPTGSYIIEVSRTDPNDTTPVTGRIVVNAIGERRTIPFTLNGDRVVVGRVDVTRQSRMVPVR